MASQRTFNRSYDDYKKSAFLSFQSTACVGIGDGIGCGFGRVGGELPVCLPKPIKVIGRLQFSYVFTEL